MSPKAQKCSALTRGGRCVLRLSPVSLPSSPSSLVMLSIQLEVGHVARGTLSTLQIPPNNRGDVVDGKKRFSDACGNRAWATRTRVRNYFDNFWLPDTYIFMIFSPFTLSKHALCNKLEITFLQNCRDLLIAQIAPPARRLTSSASAHTGHPAAELVTGHGHLGQASLCPFSLQKRL